MVDQTMDDAAEICFAGGALDTFISDTPERQQPWSARNPLLEAIKDSTTEKDECDVVVLRGETAGSIQYCGEPGKEFNLRIMSFDHAEDGSLHISVPRDDLDQDTWKMRCKQRSTLKGIMTNPRGGSSGEPDDLS